MPPKQRKARKLLVATMGVATLSYLGSSCSSTTQPGNDAGGDAFVSGNLVAPPPDARPDTVDDFPVANLVAPPVDGGH